MPKVHTVRYNVRTYELGSDGRVRLPSFLNYLEEGATQASAALGFSYDWYMENKRAWVARKTTLRFYNSATYGDELELNTWISDVRRVQSHREYALWRPSDGAPILRGRTNWAYLDTELMRPTRIPDGITELAGADGELEDLDTGVHEVIPIESPILHTDERRVQFHELDAARIVNNAMYVQWTEQAIMNQLRAVGWSPERFSTADFTMHTHSHEIEYFRSALDNEPILVTTRLAEVGKDRAAWITEIRHGATTELMARDKTVRSFTDARGARSIPDAVQLALIEPHR
jgi:YbgC/YbaW family acyl-CoA thioester hydrolase